MAKIKKSDDSKRANGFINLEYKRADGTWANLPATCPLYEDQKFGRSVINAVAQDEEFTLNIRVKNIHVLSQEEEGEDIAFG